MLIERDSFADRAINFVALLYGLFILLWIVVNGLGAIAGYTILGLAFVAFWVRIYVKSKRAWREGVAFDGSQDQSQSAVTSSGSALLIQRNSFASQVIKFVVLVYGLFFLLWVAVTVLGGIAGYSVLGLAFVAFWARIYLKSKNAWREGVASPRSMVPPRSDAK